MSSPITHSCFQITAGKFCGKEFTYNETTVDMVRQAMRLGAKVGDMVQGFSRSGFFRNYVIVAEKSFRAKEGYWANEI